MITLKPYGAGTIFSSALVLLTCALLAYGSPAEAWQFFNVTKTADTNDGACNADCSLREAIIAANANPNIGSHDVIIVPPGLYKIAIDGKWEELGAKGDFDITDPVEIRGAGAGSTIIDGSNLDRVLHFQGSYNHQSYLSGVTVRNGKLLNISTGGGIENSGSLKIRNSIITNNVNGVYNMFGGTVELVNSTVSDNQGKGVFIYTTINLPITLISKIEASTISGNSGDGIRASKTGSTATSARILINNSTISGNGGRGLWTGGFSSSFVSYSTFTGNQINIQGVNSYITFFTTIVVHPTTSINCSKTISTFVSNGYNMESDTSCGFTGVGDLQNIFFSLLGPLANNGGPTKTHALIPASANIIGSPAINAGRCNSDGWTDQRGVARPQGGKCDIGAYERIIPSNDFNNDGRSDILRRYTPDKRTLVWTMSRNVVTSALWTTVQYGVGWEVAGFGDFNGDGRSEILWRYKLDGRTLVWYMSGHKVLAAYWTSLHLSNSWKIADIGDFNGDGRADVLWRYIPDGRTLIRFMASNTVIASQWTTQFLSNGWEIAGIGDFNRDGRADILWRYKLDGRTLVWTMSGSTVALRQWTSRTSNINWEFVGIGDFNNDGNSDLLWRYKPDGRTLLWIMSGNNATAIWTSRFFPNNWSVARIADYNGDGRADILWRYSDGRTLVWTMSGASVLAVQWSTKQYNTNWTVE